MTDEPARAGADTPERARELPHKGVVRNAFALVRALSSAGRPVGVTGLAEAVGIPKTTAHRLLVQLAQEGVVTRRDRKWRLGPGLGDLMRARPEAPDVGAVAHPRLSRLSRATGGSLVLYAGSRETLQVLHRWYGARVGRVMTASEQRQAAEHPASAAWQALERGQLAVEYREAHPECNCMAAPFVLPSGDCAVLALAQPGHVDLEALKRPLERMTSLLVSDLRRLEP
jgi:DNA-binding IclR family transcriptional regulator